MQFNNESFEFHAKSQRNQQSDSNDSYNNSFFFTNPTQSKPNNIDKNSKKNEIFSPTTTKKERLLKEQEIMKNPEKFMDGLEEQHYSIQKDSRQFYIELESIKTAMKIADIEIKGKLDVDFKQFEITIEQIKRTLLRNIEEQENKFGFLNIQLETLQGENILLQKCLQRYEERIQSLEYALGVEYIPEQPEQQQQSQQFENDQEEYQDPENQQQHQELENLINTQPSTNKFTPI